MPSFASGNSSGPSAAERRVAAVSEAFAAISVMMEGFRQRLQLVEDKQTDTEATLQELNVRRQVQQESLQSLQEECRELRNGFNASAPDMSFTNPLESYQLRPSVQERRRSGITADLLQVSTQDMYAFYPSIWDIAIFIGTPCLGLGGSVIICLLLLMNIMMQVVFVGIVRFNFSEATVTETTVRAAERWRINEAHAYQSMDLQSGLSLVERVCQNDMSLQIASSQQSLYNFVNDYLKPGATGPEAFFVGKILCTVALVCWFLMVSKELNKAVGLFRGTIFLHRGPHKLVPIEQFGHPTTFRIESISRKRMILSAMIFVYRLILSFLLVYDGTFFLVYTIETQELVLNAVALEIILRIDELLFDAAATASAKYLVMSLDPLSMPHWPHGNGADLKAVCTAMLVPGAAMFVYHAMITPMVDNLNAVAHALCGGTKNFVFAEDMLRMTLFASTGPKVASISVQNLAVREVVANGLHNHSEYALLVGGAGDHHALQMRTREPFEQAIGYMSQGMCVDNLQGPYLHYMQQFMGNLTISNCMDVKYWCSSASFAPEWGPDDGKGLMARMLCPHTCECDRPGGSAFISGCPAACTERTHPVYAQSLNTSSIPNCSENPNLANSSDWMSWMAQLRTFFVFKKDSALRGYVLAMRNGCTDIAAQSVAPACRWDYKYSSVFKGIAFFCPISCDCKRKVQQMQVSGCPDSCNSGSSGSSGSGKGKGSGNGKGKGQGQGHR